MGKQYRAVRTVLPDVMVVIPKQGPRSSNRVVKASRTKKARREPRTKK